MLAATRDTSRFAPAWGRDLTAMVVGAGSGIGRAVALELAADPAVTCLIATGRDELDETLPAACAESGTALRQVTLDLTREATLARTAQQLVRSGLSLHALINCAGLLHDGPTLQPERRLADVDPARMMESYAVNAVGPALLAKHFAPLMPRQGRALFATLSARVGSIGDNRLGGWYGYRASKAAQNMVTRNIAIELRRRIPGIVCVALHPGTVDTDLSRPFQANVPAERLFTPERAAGQLLDVTGALTPADNGEFFAWDGTTIPW